jgi:ABC-2 type transport system ATP-binding protein
LIVIEKLSKSYGTIKAVDNLDLEIFRGEIFGFLGPNGAGKTTTIRILTSLTRASSGNARIDGLDISKDMLKVKKLIGVVQQTLSLDRELTAMENMQLHARLHHIGRKEREERINELLSYVELTDHSHRLVEELSGGMKRRLMIARALIHQPRLLFLDEPTVGLDAQTRRRLWELIRKLNNNGTTVFLTTHYIEEAEALCSRVGIIDYGKMITIGKPAELCLKLGPIVVVESSQDGQTRYHYFPDKTTASNFIQSLPDTGSHFVLRNTNLEDVFVELTGRKVGDG